MNESDEGPCSGKRLSGGADCHMEGTIAPGEILPNTREVGMVLLEGRLERLLESMDKGSG